jgi:high-affinity Fe2+/Pb2+ permease
MDRIRNWLWKSLGVTLDREAKIVGGLVAGSTLLAILFGSLFMMTHVGLFLLLAVVSLAAVVIVLLGGSYRTLSWSLASPEERKQIEEEIALKQWRRRARDTHFQP